MAEPSSYDVFLCHSQRDKEQVETIGQRLSRAGYSVFFDKWNVAAGDRWQDRIVHAMNRSGSAAIFIGAGESGEWRNHEVRLALNRETRDKKFRIVPVLLPGARYSGQEDLEALLAAFQWADLRQGIEDEEGFRRLACGIQGVAPGPGPGAPSTAKAARPRLRWHLALPASALVASSLVFYIYFPIGQSREPASGASKAEPIAADPAPATTQPGSDAPSASDPPAPVVTEFPVRPSPPPQPLGKSFFTLEETAPAHFGASGVDFSVSFSDDELGTLATLQISAAGREPIVESLLGPGGRIQFQSRSESHSLTIAAWNPSRKSLQLSVDPPLK
jgi:hypothetical protein